MIKKQLFTDINIKRIDDFLDTHLKDEINLPTGVPTFSSIKISINGACNRRCFFCPRVDEKKSEFLTNLKELKEIYKICEKLKIH